MKKNYYHNDNLSRNNELNNKFRLFYLSTTLHYNLNYRESNANHFYLHQLVHRSHFLLKSYFIIFSEEILKSYFICIV